MWFNKYVIIVLLSLLAGVSLAANELKKLVVVVCCYNNIKWVQSNLDSIFKQTYPHFRLIFVDDASNDGTGAFVQQYIDRNNLNDKVTLIINPERRRKLANLYRALYMCEDNEIVILIDGDDRLVNNRVFEYINTVYRDPEVWFTYGQYRNEPASEARKWGFSEKGYAAAININIIKRQLYRKNKFVFMHLRTFYAWLFKLIKLEDFISQTVNGYEGDFYPASNDLAMYFPLAEMVHSHMLFIPTVLYVRNLYSDIVGFKVDSAIQRASAQEIRKRNPYPPLKQPVYRNLEHLKNAKAHLMIFCEKNITKIRDLLASVCANMQGIEDVYILYDTQQVSPQALEEINVCFSQIHFIAYNRNTLKQVCLQCLHSLSNDHVILTSDSMLVQDSVDVGHMIYWLERTWAHAFYMEREAVRYTKKVNWLLALDEDVCTWKFCFGKGTWRNINNLNMTLYRKSFIVDNLKSLSYKSIAELEQQLTKLTVPQEKIGLFYRQSKAIQLKR